ncbi:bacillithiol biosynthesis deacetylase BshB1 [Rufibacter glacialis]|uniref:Bacillithiol biosynthesis deacetylase BshB1 n=1 Tax=Rufibacter glacialis TaxID=1259555 RepID=A0A5M8QDV3_9BACT|nr:bacillithiol biosynthesis deacetylase BshB1 [Rufibacter glacialis]KAA6434199.1 bacillithiol biosynthesis deacetylase BshB1 [Rufibacter glacialis]GGK67644.1 bacillithiol biosynthesis deacetylase BshB1 [Rufibacter glacialis]
MKLDIVAFASHPDDAELGCVGTLLVHKALGKKVGVVDLTRGELGTRGTPETRAQEAADASAIIGLDARENLGLADGFFQNDEAHQRKVIQAIRKYRPEIVLMNAVHDRHPDHGRGSKLVSEACFFAGLRQVKTQDESGADQAPWRPKAVYHYIQDRYITPDLVVDITPFWEKKVEAIRAFKTQFFTADNPDSSEPPTYISSPEFMRFVEARALEFGHAIGATYGEGFTKERYLGVKNLFDLI